jgi:hypothetical protein
MKPHTLIDTTTIFNTKGVSSEHITTKMGTILFVTLSEPASNYNPAFKIGQERLKEKGSLNFCNFGQNLNFNRL